MDLRIKNNNATKSYVITNNCTTRPRVCMKSDTGVSTTPISYLPLTTSTTQGLALRAKVNDQSYRALEFRSMSGSTTFYSSNANGQGLSSTTALTCSSTSRTEYLTQSSTSRIEYLTRSSTSAISYLTRSSTSGESYLTNSVSKYASLTYHEEYAHKSGVPYVYTFATESTHCGMFTNSRVSYTYSGSNIDGWSWTNTGFRIFLGSSGSSSISYYTTFVYGATRTSTSNTWSARPNAGMMCDSLYDGIGSTTMMNYGYYQRSVLNQYSFTHLSSANGDEYWEMSGIHTEYAAAASSTSRITARGNLRTSMSQITGTSYLTRSSTYSTVYYTRSSTYDTVYYTRSSTYSTIYHTRSSTSGYSGVSSSSSETSGWQ